VVWLAKRVKITETETKAGKASHFDSPLGTLDVTPEEELDARLASILIYPGSLRQSPLSADMVSDHTSLQEVFACLLDSACGTNRVGILPDWPRKLDESIGMELIHPEPDGARLIRVTREKEKDRTVIETCIKPPGYPHLFAGRSYG
jgi:hypothetical protein